MKRVLVVLATIAAMLGTATAAGAQTAIASDESVWVIPTNEGLMIARHTLACTRR